MIDYSVLKLHILRQSQYFGHVWSLTKFCVQQFKGKRVNVTKAESTALRAKIASAKGFDDVKDIAGEWTGADELALIEQALRERPPRERRMLPSDFLLPEDVPEEVAPTASTSSLLVTPPNTQNPEAPTSKAPLLPNDFKDLGFPPSPASTPTPAGTAGNSSLATATSAWL